MLNLQFAALWAKLLLIPRHCLYAGITVLAILGVYAITLYVVLAAGLIGAAVQHMRRRRAEDQQERELVDA